MAKTLVIGDLHFNNKPLGLLPIQKKCIVDLFKKESVDEVVLLGDLMMHRKPTPSVLLAIKEVLEVFVDAGCKVFILRGNHDSETKADDGVTALSVFDKLATIITHTYVDKKRKSIYIPHYEDEAKIKEVLRTAPDNYRIYGHFGYNGCLNSAGDADFSLPLRIFNNSTILGHIHKFNRKALSGNNLDKSVTTLGTPYTTNFGESGKQNYYLLIEDGEFTYKEILHGPRHLVINQEEIKDNLEFINDTSYETYLRVLCNPGENPNEIPYTNLDVVSVDVKYLPSFDEDNISDYSPKRDLFSVNEVIINDYVEMVPTTLPKERILRGYDLIKDGD